MHWQRTYHLKIFLALLLALSTAARARAACQIEGPSLEETAKYLIEAGRKTVPDFSLTYSVPTGVIQINSGFTQSVAAYLLDCSTYVVDGHPSSVVRVWCRDNIACVNKTRKTGEPFTEPALHVYYEDDDEHAMRVARALSHFIYLLQKEHDETADPFSAKH